MGHGTKRGFDHLHQMNYELMNICEHHQVCGWDVQKSAHARCPCNSFFLKGFKRVGQLLWEFICGEKVVSLE
jgi:hypothetical protein